MFVKGYKIFNVENGGNLTSTQFKYTSKFFTIYNENKWNKVKPELRKLGYGFTLFTDLVSLKRYLGNAFSYDYVLRGRDERRIFEILCNGIYQPKHSRITTYYRHTINIDTLNSIVSNNIPFTLHLAKWPSGTKMTNSLKLLNEIDAKMYNEI